MLKKAVVNERIGNCYVNGIKVETIKVSPQVFKDLPGVHWNGFAVVGKKINIAYGESQDLRVTIPVG